MEINPCLWFPVLSFRFSVESKMFSERSEASLRSSFFDNLRFSVVVIRSGIYEQNHCAPPCHSEPLKAAKNLVFGGKQENLRLAAQVTKWAT